MKFTKFFSTFPIFILLFVAMPVKSAFSATPTVTTSVASGNYTFNKAYQADQTAHLKLVKTVTKDNSGTALPTAWTLYGDGTGSNDYSGAGGFDLDVNVDTEILTCNGNLIGFENGIPSGWTVIDNTGGTGITWGTTADSACEIPNRTNGSGEAACADSDAAGTPAIPYDTVLVSNPFNLTGFATAQLDVAAYYWDIITGNDRFEIDIWDGSTWTNELSWDETHGTEDISLNLSSYLGLSNVQVRFRYFGDGFDWFAQVDNIGLTCGEAPDSVEVVLYNDEAGDGIDEEDQGQ